MCFIFNIENKRIHKKIIPILKINMNLSLLMKKKKTTYI